MITARFLEHVLQHRTVPAWFDESADQHETWTIHHGMRRLARSMANQDFGLDQAVLLRQCLRQFGGTQRLVVPQLPDFMLALLSRVGVRQDLDGTVNVERYQPSWLVDAGAMALDMPASEPVPLDRPLQGEPWLLERLGKRHWKSRAQRDATWCALTGAENSTLLIGLPTGGGKSFVYQVCAAFETGLTLLVVPTVALGIDQLEAVKALPIAKHVRPCFYTPEQDADGVIDAIKSNQCRLLIASPEAVVAGRLRPILEQRASDGWLKRVVIDEAHIVESWGADFRIEFQLLGSLLRQWRRDAPEGIRLLLLSATFTPGAPKMLRNLFTSDGDHWDERIYQRLRPEIHYFAPRDWLTEEQKIEYVEEALRHLARPAILYLTEKVDAETWVTLLRDRGYRRLAAFHGDTRPSQRKTLMLQWRMDELDLVVATSAFGMGVDKPDVRAVVHACYPEGIDRFYQEVGRGGRDGARTASLLMPTWRDRRVAGTMGPTLLRDEDKVNGRWRAMWMTRSIHGDTGLFRIQTDAQPDYRLGIRSYRENARWNKRLLLLMERARLIRIVAVEREERLGDMDPAEYAIVESLVATIELQQNVAKLLGKQRDREVHSINQSLELLTGYFQRARPVCRQLRDHYGQDTVRACGSCFQCRNHHVVPQHGTELSLMTEARMTGPRVFVVQAPSIHETTGFGKVAQVIRHVLRSGIARRFAVIASNRSIVRDLLDRADDRSGIFYRLDELGDIDDASLSPEESVVVFHLDTIDDVAAASLNRRGRWVAHLALGAPIESVPGRWAFMHDYASRPFPGPEGLNHWLAEARQLARRTESP
ncbi:helicase-related protein [Variovorax sp. J22R133]|uniref:DEAD/DEAH box helicase n=1 Tax=Variovorax brevis TaxID=3053503 RepID=UPI00257589C6|nr:DEAD/DEAH box helicase [Variovorax sp. J22R133]MDM0117527.1 helicase-related protein [Variovorax sp. J22R133]